MPIKTLKIFLLIHFLVNYPCFSQKKTESDSTNSVLVLQYNDWLKSVHLNGLIKATNFSFEKQVSQTGSLGDQSFSNVHVLTLAPDSSFHSRSVFAGEWSKFLKDGPSDDNIYQVLFTKLVDYYKTEPDQLLIKFRFNESDDVFSFLIYFDKGIKVNKSLIGVRGPTSGLEPGDLDDNAVGGILTNIPANENLNLKIVKGLTAFFKKHKHKNPVVVDQKNWGSGNIRFKVSNIQGEVTGNLHEIITINVFIQPSEKDRVDVSFLFTVLCASGIFSSPDDIDLYKDALISKRTNVAAYGIRLKQQLRAIIK